MAHRFYQCLIKGVKILAKSLRERLVRRQANVFDFDA